MVQLKLAYGVSGASHFLADANILLVVTVGLGFVSIGNVISKTFVVLNSASAEKVNI